MRILLAFALAMSLTGCMARAAITCAHSAAEY